MGRIGEGEQAEDLDWVRHQLDRLARMRLIVKLDDREEAEYERLARRERELMAREKASYN